jgi:hypothetical protein
MKWRRCSIWWSDYAISYIGQYWEGKAEPELRLCESMRRADVVIRQHGEVEQQLTLEPVTHVFAQTKTLPYRLVIDKPFGGRIMLWLRPLAVSVVGRL